MAWLRFGGQYVLEWDIHTQQGARCIEDNVYTFMLNIYISITYFIITYTVLYKI